ncbi:MAG: tandem-95 repeat protein, partial [Desulfobacteraceae bacterium]|nr:tandem-95 repeat protein [Desulfobacteraceae bacterium]
TESGLVAYYKFDEASGASVLPDITGKGHNGTLVNGPAWVASGWPSPPTVTITSPISGITTTSATGGGDVSGVGITARGVCYGTSASPTSPCTTNGTGAGAYSSPFASLSACTTYNVRAYATNVAGTSYGSDVPFKTKCLPVITPSPSVSVMMDEDGMPTAWVTHPFVSRPRTFDALTWSLSTAASHGSAAVSGSGASPSITYVPNADYIGTDSFVATVSDVDGSASITINVTINSANDPPSFTKGADQIADEDSGAKTVSGWATAISKGSADESAQILTFNVTNSNNALFSVQPAIDSAGTLTYTPAPDMNGSASVTITLKDDGGGTDTSTPQTFTITINPTNDPPVNTVLPAIIGNALVGATITADSGTWNDTKDTSLGGTSTITYSYLWQRADDLSGTNAADISGAASNSYTLTAADKFIRVKVTATDTGVGTPATQSAFAYSAYSMAGNTAPKIAQTSPISVTMDEDGSPTAWTAPTVTATDANNDTLTWSVKAAPVNGTAVVSGSGASPTTFTYTPKQDYTGTDSFVIQVSDGKGGFADMTIDVTISAVNDLPAADAGKAQTVYVGSKVVLDGSASKDTDGTIALYTWTQTAGTSVTLSDSKAIQPYFTAPSAPETLSFRLTVKDNAGEESSASVTITVVKAGSPIAGFSAAPLTGTVPLKVQFTDSSQGDISQWEWDFGDGTKSLEKNPLHQYVTAGTYTVKLTVTGPGGTNTYTNSNYITVSSAALSVDFTGSPLTGVAPLTVYFHSVVQGSFSSMLWDFGDSQTSALPDPIHIYEKPGIYTVSLTVSDSAARSKRSSVNMTKAGYIVVSGRTISGTVTGEDTHLGLADFRIEVWKDGKIIGQAVTDASGKYTVADIPALDNLIVSAWNPSSGLAKYYTQFYSGQRWPIDATALSSISGDLSGIDFVMKRLPTTGIRGRVHDGVHGIAGVEVDIFSQKVNVAANAITDADGYYEVTGLELSDDYLSSVHSAQLNTDFFYSIPEGQQVGVYVPTESVFTQDRATRITPVDPLIPNIDIIVKADAANSVEGHVYTEDGKPLSGIDVNAWSDGLNTGNGAKTDADGHYIIYGLVKVADADVQSKGYVIEARSSDYVYQVYNKVSGTDNATLVATGAAGIDFYLKTGLSISGNVKDMNGSPASNVKIVAWSDSDITQKQGTVYTDNTGNYTISNLPPASDYIVAAYATGYPVQYYKLTLDKAAAQYVSIDTENVQNIDFALDKGLVIRGAVYLGNTSTPAPQGITVHVQSASSASAADVQTDAQGKYEFVGLDKTVFDYVISIHYSGYVPAYYAAAGTASSRNDADRVAPAPVSAAADRNFVLITGYKNFRKRNL